MKKMSKIEVIKLLKNRTMSYKALSLMTGYHSKSLIRINKFIKEGNINLIHGNKNTRSHNYIDDSIRESIIDEYKKNTYKNYKDFYNKFIKDVYSYSFICRLLSSNIPKVKTKNNNKTNKIENKKIIKRKLIADNIIQYKNTRYNVLGINLKHHTKVDLVIDNDSNTIYIIYDNKNYKITKVKDIISKTGLSKY